MRLNIQEPQIIIKGVGCECSSSLAGITRITDLLNGVIILMQVNVEATDRGWVTRQLTNEGII